MKRSELEKAIRDGDLEKVRELIAAGADVSAAFGDGTPPILLAARERQITILRALAAAGAELSELEVLSFEERLVVMFEAFQSGESDDDLMSPGDFTEWSEHAVAELMDEDMAAEIRALEGDLFRAVRTGDLDLLKERLAAGDDVDLVREVTRDTPLTLAVQKGDEEMVGELISAGANVNHDGFSTPLSFALPDLRLAKLLLDAGADVHERGLDRQSPLERAVSRALRPKCSADSPLLVRFFLEAGVHPPNAESFPGTLLQEAAYDEGWEVYQELLPHYPDEVASENFEELKYDRQVDEADGGLLAWSFDLRQAARTGDVDELRELLEKRSEDVSEEAGLAVWEALSNLQTSRKDAPQLAAVRVLISAGANLDVAKSYEQRRGTTPLACAAESWHRQSEEAMRLLLEGGADIDQRGGSGRTPLMYAVLVAYRHGAALEKAVPLLLDAGADLALEDEFGHTAWTLAKAPLIEEEERSRTGTRADGDSEPIFDGPDLSDLMSASANKADRRRDRFERCRRAVELLEAAGAEPRGEAELRLVLAAGAGDEERVAELLRSGAAAAARGTDGKPAVVAAAESGRSGIVARLIAAGCEADAHVPGRPSALEVAVRAADLEMTRQLLDAGANPVMLACMSSGALKAAEAAGGSNVVQLIRETLPPEIAYLDRDVEAEIAADDLYWDSLEELPRQAAAGDLDKVRELLAVKDIEIDGFDALRRTALSAAAEAGRIEVVRELIARGADVGKCNGVIGSPRSTPLTCAAISSSAERDAILRSLLEAGADPDQLGADGRTALMHAVERDVGFFGRTGEFALSTRTLIAAGADLEIRDPYGLTAWTRAMSLASSIDIDEVAEQYEAIARLLEEAGAETSGLLGVELVWAVEVAEVDRVRELLAAGADPDARRHDGATPVMLAVRDGDRDLVRLLLDAGCDAGARQWLDRGPTAADAAESAKDRKLVRMLVAAGASPPVDRLHRARTSSPIRDG